MKQYNNPKVEVSVVQVEAGFELSGNTVTGKDTYKTILGSDSNPEEM